MSAEKVSRTIEDLLREMGLASVSLLADLSASWAAVVGPLLARKSRPSRLKGGVLTVCVPTHSWAQELSLASPVLLERIGARCGPGKVTSIRFRVEAPTGEEGGPDAAGSAGKRGGRPPEAPEGPAETGPEGLDSLGDPEIRDILASLSRKAGSRRR